jgi:hypothetical protein
MIIVLNMLLHFTYFSEGESELHKKPAMLTKTGRPVVQTVQPQSFIDPFRYI